MNYKLVISLFFIIAASVNALAGNDIVLYNGNIIDTDTGEIRYNSSVYIKDGVIVDIKPSAKRCGKGELDVTGKYILPGLIDSHTHYSYYCEDSLSAASISNLYFRNGVTTVRDVGGNYLYIKEYNDLRNSGDLVGPDIYYSSIWATGEFVMPECHTAGSKEDNTPWSRMLSVKDSTDSALEEAVMQAKSVGCTGFKLYVNYSKSDLERLVPIIKKHGMKIWAHSSQVIGATAMDVAESGVEVMSHAYMIPKYFYPAATLSQNDKEYVSSVLDKMVENNVVLDATYKLSLRNGTTFASEVIKAAYEKGVKLVVGTDLPGCELHNEIELLSKDCGISNIDILRAATVTGAEIIGKKGTLGEIKVGAEADAIILNENPLIDLSALSDIDITISNGQVVYESTSTSSDEVVLYNANIVDTEKGCIQHRRTIHIKDGYIAKISRASKTIEEDQIDMTGKYVMPGLIDAHVHFGNMAQNRDMAARLSEDFLSSGITTVRDMGSNFLNIKRHHEDVAAGLYKGPRVYYSSFWATGNYYMDPLDIIGWEDGPDAPWSRKFSIKDSTDTAIFKAVKEAKDIGCTGFKLYIHYSLDDVRRLVPIAKQLGMKVWAHATQVTGATALEMAESGVDVLSHAYMLCDDIKARESLSHEEIAYVREVCKRLKKNNVVLDITAYISLFDGLKFSNDVVKVVCEEKVPFVVGTDFFGSAILEEIACLKNAGYSNKDILCALTATGAKILGEQGTLGCVKEGAYADLLILASDPLTDISALQEIELFKL